MKREAWTGIHKCRLDTSMGGDVDGWAARIHSRPLQLAQSPLESRELPMASRPTAQSRIQALASERIVGPSEWQDDR
jgi:hypothetical protein